jgi:hypothetical protein
MIKLTHAQIRPGVKGVDVIVKSAKGFARSFAPNWKMVLGYKNGTLNRGAVHCAVPEDSGRCFSRGVALAVRAGSRRWRGCFALFL